MSPENLQQLVRALDPATRRDLEASAQRCVERCASHVRVEDLLLGLLERPEGVLGKALEDAGIEVVELASFLCPHSASDSVSRPELAPELVQWLEDGWSVASLQLSQPRVDQVALLLALVRNPQRYLDGHCRSILARLDGDRLFAYALSAKADGHAPACPAQGKSLLERFTCNLTQQAREGLLDAVFCRDDAIRQMVDILTRRRKNNPIVVGEPGVGKTAVVEGLALKIAAGEVPASLGAAELLMLDMGLLQAGASIKGEFERRLTGVIAEVKASPQPIILFIDEAHCLIGAGNQPGAGDAANLLKPALARGELRTIAATTWGEYKKYFEKDPALSRRFQPVPLHEPSTAEAVAILRGLKTAYERSHGVHVRDDAVVAAAELSARYLSERQLPDKAVDVLDTACARVRISLAAVPDALTHLREQRLQGERQCQAWQRDTEAGLTIAPAAFETLQSSVAKVQEEERLLNEQWLEQKSLAEEVLTLREQLSLARSASVPSGQNLEVATLEARLQVAYAALKHAQTVRRLVNVEVCPWLVAQVISGWTGLPLSQLAREHSARIACLRAELGERIRGQDHALDALDRCARAAAAGLGKPDAPDGVFLLVGPSGVGKTETALALAELLYGGGRFLITINMSEFQERHSIARLIGAPPGYVGYGEGGMLTEAVRRHPYSVVLLDEVEKADPDVLDLFYQIFDKGVATDGEGREIDFRNTLILMTSNLGSDRIEAHCQNGQRPEVSVLKAAIWPLLNRHFKPALLARMRVVPYYPLGTAQLAELVTLKLTRLGARLAGQHIGFSHCTALVEQLIERCEEGECGARLIDHLIETALTPCIADRLLASRAMGEVLQKVRATVDGQGSIICECQ